jgi:hypothetical protein
MRGQGSRYEVVEQLFRSIARRINLLPPPTSAATSFRRPFQQGSLFG